MNQSGSLGENRSGKSQSGIYWRQLGRDFVARLKPPAHHPSFVLYFFGIIAGLGGFGVWLQLYRSVCGQNPIIDGAMAIANYVLVLICTAAVDFLLAEKGQTRSMRMVYVCIGIFTGILVIVIWMGPEPKIAYIFSIFALLLSWLIWWMINADNERILETEDLTETLGGDVEKEPSGDLNGIKY